ncbi:hypothetical protein ACJJI4_03450 [Microbulbifer sp. TRSA002]|uniref:hypothetical protein n=1 Tax=Microbulbifer sp. TRSA002 TaxID=3243382 RepID=UPI00403A216B
MAQNIVADTFGEEVGGVGIVLRGLEQENNVIISNQVSNSGDMDLLDENKDACESREPLSNYVIPLGVLKVADVRRSSPRMALALCKSCNAADAAFKVSDSHFALRLLERSSHSCEAAP